MTVVAMPNFGSNFLKLPVPPHGQCKYSSNKYSRLVIIYFTLPRLWTQFNGGQKNKWGLIVADFQIFKTTKIPIHICTGCLLLPHPHQLSFLGPTGIGLLSGWLTSPLPFPFVLITGFRQGGTGNRMPDL